MILSTDSPDFWCQNSLLKLQSLLLSPLCQSSRNQQLWPSCKEIVTGYLAMKDETIGSLSLRLICVLDDDKSRSVQTFYLKYESTEKTNIIPKFKFDFKLNILKRRFIANSDLDICNLFFLTISWRSHTFSLIQTMEQGGTIKTLYWPLWIIYAVFKFKSKLLTFQFHISF